LPKNQTITFDPSLIYKSEDSIPKLLKEESKEVQSEPRDYYALIKLEKDVLAQE
jgi:hypothetical protein